MPSTREKKRIISDFLQRCNTYAEAQLDRYRAQLETATGMEQLSLQDKIGHWTAYHKFNLHTLEELGGTTLDDWFK